MTETTDPTPPRIRIGQGFDVHAFGDGDHVMLGGVRVPHARGVLAHSDGDVVLHALCDAILGALADGQLLHCYGVLHWRKWDENKPEPPDADEMDEAPEDKERYRIMEQVGMSNVEVKSAIETLFKVTVASVNMINIAGKRKRSAKGSGRRNNIRKAYVSLADGQTIDIVAKA